MSLPDLLGSFDDAALAALASAGLMKRALKDRETETAEIVTLTEVLAQVIVEGFTVTIPPKGPAAARCTCPAPGICRHIVHAIMVLRDAPKGSSLEYQTRAEPPQNARDALVALTDADVATFAGAVLDEALALVPLAGAGVDGTEGGTIRVTFPAMEGEVSFVPNQPLEEALFKGPKSRRRALIVAALIVIRQRNGLAGPVGLVKPDPEPLLDEGWLDAVAASLTGSVAQVFRGLAASAAETFLDLGVSARAGAAPRLASELLTLSNMAAMAREQSVQFDPPEFLARLARTLALTETLRTRSTDAVMTGMPRRDFAATAPMSCQVLGAERWTTLSGARGLTLHLWDVAALRHLRVTQARAGGADPDFSPIGAYKTALWGLQPPSRLVGHLLEISEPFLAKDGSLSPSRCSGAKILRPLKTADLRSGGALHGTWSAVLDAGKMALGSGLSRSAVPVMAVLERPASGTVALDDIAQTYTLSIADLQGQVEPVALTAETATEAASLASLVHRSSAILVQLKPGWNSVTLSLISVLCPDGDRLAVVNPGIDPLQDPTRMQQVIAQVSRVFRSTRKTVPSLGQNYGERVLVGLCDLWQAGPPAGLAALATEAEARQVLTLARILERLQVRADSHLTLVAAYLASELAYHTGS